MKYVDEFRDRAKARVLVEARSRRWSRRIDRPRRPAAPDHGSLRRPHPFDLPLRHRGHAAASRSSWCTARAARCACCRWGGSTTASRSPSSPDVIFTTFGDAMRVPGSTKSLLQAKADGADVRMVYSPMDALALARANPDREVVFFGLGFETTMPSTALTVLQAEREGIAQFLGVLQPHHHRPDHQGDPRQPRSAARRLPRARATSRW